MRVRILGLLGLLGLLSLWGAKGSRGNPLILTERDKVLKTLSSFKEALNNRDIDGILSFFSREYKDSLGIRYKDLKGIFERFFREVRGEKSYPIFYFYNPRVRIRGDRAEAEYKIIIKGQQPNKKPVFYNRETRIILRRQGKSWRIIQIGEEFLSFLKQAVPKPKAYLKKKDTEARSQR